MNVREIIEKAGGPDAIARRSGEIGGKKVTAQAVIKWGQRSKIPEAHWSVIRDLVPDLTIEDLFRANYRGARFRQRAAA